MCRIINAHVQVLIPFLFGLNTYLYSCQMLLLTLPPHDQSRLLSENPSSQEAVSVGCLHNSISGNSNMFSHSFVVKDELNEFNRVDLKETLHGSGEGGWHGSSFEKRIKK